MKIFLACRYGLGDILSGYLCPVNYGQPNAKALLLMRLRNACRAGACESAFVISRFGFWECLDFPLKVRTAVDFNEPLPGNGWDREELAGHRNLLRPPRELLEFPAHPPVELPLRSCLQAVPNEFILFTDGAGGEDRALEDRQIVDWLQLHLPVVRIGVSDSHYKLPMGPFGATSAMVDLSNQLSLPEVFWLAKHARAIVSPCSYLRTMSSLVGTPVLELLQRDRVTAGTIARTIKEYRGLEYGMTPGKSNYWCFWDGQPTEEMRQFLERCMTFKRRSSPILAETNRG